MKVTKRLQINIVVSSLATLLVFAILVTAFFKVKSAIETSNIAGELVNGIYLRSELRNDYVRNTSERAKIQWFSEHEEIGKLLKAAAERFTEPEDKVILHQLAKGHESIRNIFSRIVENREKKGPATRLDAVSREIEDRLLSQLTMRRYNAILNARRLQNAGNERLLSVFDTAGWGIIGVIAVFTLATVINSWLMARMISHRITRLQAGALSIGEGNLDHRILIKGEDEFAELAGAFNTMTAKLRESYLALEKEVSERMRAEQDVIKLNDDLRRSVQKLVEANKELEAFSYSVSHDLRSPLRSIDGFSLALLEDHSGSLDAEGREYLERVRTATQRMSRLIDDLLNLSRMSRMEMRHEPVDLSALARDIAGRLARDQPDRAAEFIIADGLTAFGDGRLLNVVLENLISNAWKFSEKSSRSVIEFGTAECGSAPDQSPHEGGDSREGRYRAECAIKMREQLDLGKTAYYVRDNGAGFDMTYVNKLFTPFQRLHTASDFSGTGIGLATVQRIISRHGGCVWIEGEVGKGTTVYFSL